MSGTVPRRCDACGGHEGDDDEAGCGELRSVPFRGEPGLVCAGCLEAEYADGDRLDHERAHGPGRI